MILNSSQQDDMMGTTPSVFPAPADKDHKRTQCAIVAHISISWKRASLHNPQRCWSFSG